MAVIIYSQRKNRWENIFPTRTLEQRQVSNHLFECESFSVFAEPGQDTPRIYETDQHVLGIFGSPVYEEVALERFGDLVWLLENLSTEILKVDSSFLIFCFDKRQQILTIYTDRFGSIILFYFIRADLVACSTNVIDLYKINKKLGNQNVSREVVFEYFWFRRLFGQKTYVDNIKVFPPASICRFNDGRLDRIDHYWQPTPCLGITQSVGDWAEQIKESITKGVNISISNSGKSGLMLSGGLDSRALLSVGNERYVSITNTPSINQEYLVANQLAKLVGSTHHHLIRPHRYLDQIFEEAIKASNGMIQYYECQFLGYKDKLKSLVHDIHLGLFLDVFFCGHYMPKRHRSFGKRQSVHFVLNQIENTNFATYFVSNVSYREKNTDLRLVTNSDTYSRGLESVVSEINSVMQLGKNLGFKGIELWEFIHLTNIGRHYSMLMASSLRPYISVHLPALTIENYDAAFGLPPSMKYNWNVYLEALRQLDPKLMNVMNANTNNIAKYGLVTQTLLKVFKGIANAARSSTFQLSPNAEDRSWPLVRQSLDKEGEIASRLEKTLESGAILDFGIFEPSALRKLYKNTKSGQEDHSVFLNQLLTIEEGVLKHI